MTPSFVSDIAQYGTSKHSPQGSPVILDTLQLLGVCARVSETLQPQLSTCFSHHPSTKPTPASESCLLSKTSLGELSVTLWRFSLKQQQDHHQRRCDL